MVKQFNREYRENYRYCLRALQVLRIALDVIPAVHHERG